MRLKEVRFRYLEGPDVQAIELPYAGEAISMLCLLPGEGQSIADLEKKLTEWENFYNFARPHGAFKGKTPYKALRENL